jgi:5-aminolevulinate synthase
VVTGMTGMWHRPETKLIHIKGIGHDPWSLGTGPGRGILTKKARWTTNRAMIMIPRKIGKST